MTVEEIKNGLDAAHKKAGDNAYFGNGFHAGVAFAEKKSKANEMYEALKQIDRHFEDGRKHDMEENRYHIWQNIKALLNELDR